MICIEKNNLTDILNLEDQGFYITSIIRRMVISEPTNTTKTNVIYIEDIDMRKVNGQ